VRVYVEDSGIGLHLTCTGGALDPNKKIGPSSAGAFLQTDIPENASCKLSLFHVSKELLNRKVYLEEKARATILVANWRYTKTNYNLHHEKGLDDCKSAQWPLALAKNMELVTNSDEQSYYHYPLVRYPIGRNYVSSALEMNTYYFRFNET